MHVTATHQTHQTQQDRQQALGRLFDPANRPDPYPVFHRLRETGPFALLDNALVVVGDYDRCAAILRDPAMSSDRRHSRLPRNLADQGDAPPVSFLSLDPPDHTRLRRLVSKAFTPRVIAALEPDIRRIVDELFADVAEAGSLDVVPRLAYPLPVRIITQLLGVPREDHEQFEGWGRRLVRGLDPSLSFTDQSQIDDIHEAQSEFRAYFLDLIAARRRAPTDDLLSKLVRIEEQGDVLTEDELVGTCVLLLVAGHETTANLIAGGILALLRNPDQLAALRADPSLVSSTVEESLRYDTPVQLTTRIVRQPTLIGDVEVPADAVLLLLLGAANRDPAAFPEPDRFDITRDARQHLSFAAGIHFCLGAGLARLEASIALSAFANRVRGPVLDEDSLRYRPHVNLRGPERMIVSFERISS
jgi:hypothetical protein